MGPFAAIQVTDDGVVKRFRQAGLAPLSELFSHVSGFFADWLTPQVGTAVAPFASRVVALDEPTWEAMQRHLLGQRALPDGDVGLLPGKRAGRFDLRTQHWEWVQLRSDPQANCTVAVCCLLEGLPEHRLVLFDLGSFRFACFDDLTQMHDWVVCRLREQTTSRLAQSCSRSEGILDAFVWLGSTHGAHAGHLVGLVRCYDGHHLRCYLSKVLDPPQLSLPDVARLSTRRWDSEWTFLPLKRLLGWHQWCSSHPVLMQQHILAVLISAQVVQALRLHVARQAGIDPFEVCFPLLLQALPHFLLHRLAGSDWVLPSGPQIKLLGPSSRKTLILPQLDLAQ